MVGLSTPSRFRLLLLLGLAVAVILAVVFLPGHYRDAPTAHLLWGVHGTVALLLLVIVSWQPNARWAVLRSWTPTLPLLLLGVWALPTADAWQAAAELSAKTLLSTATLAVVFSQASASEWCRVFQTLGLPTIWIQTLDFMLRYQNLLSEERLRMDRALAARGLLGHSPRTWRPRASLVGQLLLRSLSRAERLYRAMLARGLDTGMRPAEPAVPPGNTSAAVRP